MGPSSNKDELGSQLDILREELNALLGEEGVLDDHSEIMQNSLRSLAEDAQVGIVWLSSGFVGGLGWRCG